jgi:transcriptional regulator with XRE-family HTH domain
MLHSACRRVDDPAMTSAPSPVAARRRLAAELHRARAAAGLTLQDAAAGLECSTAKISRIEARQVGASIVDVRALADLYSIDGADRDALLDLARVARGRGWWHPYADMLPGAFATFIGLEDEATAIDTYEPHVIPGLLQTPGYARAVMQSRRDEPAETVTRGLALRAARQEILARGEPPALRVVVDEAALLRPAGDGSAMAGQYERLVDVAGRPGVSLQVVPMDAASVAAGGTAFTVLRFADPAEPAVAYAELLTEAYLVDRAEDVGRYAAQFDALRGAALDPEASAVMLRGLLTSTRGGEPVPAVSAGSAT